MMFAVHNNTITRMMGRSMVTRQSLGQRSNQAVFGSVFSGVGRLLRRTAVGSGNTPPTVPTHPVPGLRAIFRAHSLDIPRGHTFLGGVVEGIWPGVYFFAPGRPNSLFTKNLIRLMEDSEGG